MKIQFLATIIRHYLQKLSKRQQLLVEIFKEKLFSQNYEMNNNTTFVVIAIVSALASFGVVAVTVATTMQLQEAEAKGCRTTQAVNASQGRCFFG